MARVVAAVPPEAQALAWLHDVLEQSGTTTTDLSGQGLTDVELAALELLTRGPGESYELHVLRIAYAPGPAGRLARTVKLADLDDHISREWVPGSPPYAWARRHVATGRARLVLAAGELPREELEGGPRLRLLLAVRGVPGPRPRWSGLPQRAIGIDTSGEQQTKTRTALEFFAGELAGG